MNQVLPWAWKLKTFLFVSWPAVWTHPQFHNNTPAMYLVRFSHQAGCQERVSFQSSCWAMALSSGTFWHRALIMSLSFPGAHMRSHRPNMAISGIVLLVRDHLLLSFLLYYFLQTDWGSCLPCRRCWTPILLLQHGRLFSQRDELHLTVPCLSIQHHLQPAHSLYCHSLMAALWRVC